MSDEVKNEEVKETEKAPESAQAAVKPKKKKKLWLRILCWTLGVLAVLLITAVIARDAIIRHSVVKIGSAVTGTKVEMDSFSSSFGGTVELNGFRVGNPEGYRDPYAIQVAKIRVSIDVGSLFSDKIEVKEVLVSGTEVNYELKPNGSSNLTDIKNNVDAFAGPKKEVPKEGQPEEKPKEEAEAEAAAQKQVVIRLVTIDDSTLSLSSALLGTRIPLPLPPLTLTNLGEGKSFGETISQFVTEVLAAITTAVSKSGLKNVGDALTGAGKNLGDSLVQGGGALKDAGKGLGDTVSGLFK